MYILCHCYIFLSYTSILFFFFFNDTATTEIYTLSLHDALPIFFSSTLELDQLLPLIGSKFRELLECQTINVWLLEADQSLTLMQQAGFDPTTSEGQTQKPGGGIAGDASDSGEPVLIDTPEDERLVARNAGVDGGAIFSLMLGPLGDRGALGGVVGGGNKN